MLTIILASINQADPVPVVYVTLEDGTVHNLFEFYSDELSFTEAEFVGLTLEQGLDLFTKKDVAYLQS